MNDEEIRIKALELALNSMYWTNQPRDKDTYGSALSDKPMREIYNRADSIYTYIKDPSDSTPQGIIAKLRDVLCQEVK